MKTAGHILQWAVALGIFWFLFHKYPPRELWEAARGAHWAGLLLFGTFYFLLMWGVDTWGLASIFRHLDGTSIPYRNLLQARAHSYLISVVNYGAGQGVLAYLLSKRGRKPLVWTTGFVFLISLSDLYLIGSFALVGSLVVQPSYAGYDLKKFVLLLWVLGTVGLMFLILGRRLLTFSFLKRLPTISFRGFLYFLSIRLPVILIIMTAFYFVPFFFGARIPFSEIVAKIPIVLLIGALPLTPGGIGTVQFAMVELLKNSVQTNLAVNISSLLLSMNLVWTFINYGWKSVAGFVAVMRGEGYKS